MSRRSAPGDKRQWGMSFNQASHIATNTAVLGQPCAAQLVSSLVNGT